MKVIPNVTCFGTSALSKCKPDGNNIFFPVVLLFVSSRRQVLSPPGILILNICVDQSNKLNLQKKLQNLKHLICLFRILATDISF